MGQGLREVEDGLQLGGGQIEYASEARDGLAIATGLIEQDRGGVEQGDVIVVARNRALQQTDGFLESAFAGQALGEFEKFRSARTFGIQVEQERVVARWGGGAGLHELAMHFRILESLGLVEEVSEGGVSCRVLRRELDGLLKVLDCIGTAILGHAGAPQTEMGAGKLGIGSHGGLVFFLGG